MPKADDRSTLVYALETLAPLRDEIEAAPGATIRHRSVTADELGQKAIRSLMEATQRERTVTLGDTLGQGGMGVVHLAEQVALGRVVAVKRLHSEKSDQRHVLALMREAWVTGSLEHPNIVPVHDVGLDDTGQPFLVMKRIEGEHWGRLIRRPDEVQSRFGVADVQGWHLGVLQQVCHALAFAHARRVIHRDLKPENVMVGAFGEVYLLDWGIALSLEPDPTGRLPTATGKETISGTPAYMAPEMLGGEVGPWTDVYLLGGLLYEVLAGRAPHQGEDIETLLEAVKRSEPEPPDGPDELVALCMAALSREPSGRPESAEAFRHDLAMHLEHRQVLLVAEQAQECLTRLERAREEEVDGELLWNMFSEARFGFRQALKAWPEHEPSRRGLATAVEAMVRWSLDNGDHAAAARSLAEHPDPTPELEAEVSRAQARARRIARDQDTMIGQRTRWFVAVMLALIWSAFPLGLWWWKPVGGHEATVLADGFFVLLILGLGVWARESLSKTALNRKTWSVLLFTPAAEIILSLGMIQLGLDAVEMMPLHLFLWFVVCWMVTLAVEWRFWPSALGYTGAWLAGATWPPDAMLWGGFATLVLAANITIVWWPPARVPVEERVPDPLS